MNKIVLYHGTNQEFEVIDLSKSKDKRDFGKGFYMTTLQEQAAQWADNMFVRYGGSNKYIYKYELEITEDLSVKYFESLSVEWLHMIRDNRIKGGTQHGYDLVRGPVADDNTMRTIALFISGIYDEDMALTQLRYFKANDQISVHTKKALSHLRFIERINNGK